jgi:urea transporter
LQQLHAYAYQGILGLVVSTGTALVMGFNENLYRIGIFGYNGILVGLALATFNNGGKYDLTLVPMVTLLSLFSTLIAVALGDIFAPRNIPSLTLPFNFAATMLLLGAAQFNRLNFGVLEASLPEDTPNVPLAEYSVDLFIAASIRGFGQVM